MELNESKIREIAKKFEGCNDIISLGPFGSGHINETFLVECKRNEERTKYIIRKINSFVFKKPELIIHNTILVTNHIKDKLIENGEADINRKVLTLLRTDDGKYSYIDDTGDYWCLMLFIANAYSVDKVETEQQAYEAAKAFGKFQKYLSDFNTSLCHETIKDFHALDKRLLKFDESVANDIKNRVGKISREINLVEDYRYLNKEFLLLQEKNMPIRITHNDTKINNVLLDVKTDKGLCVVDLDTVMPGIILNDFGDMVRTFTSPASEDEEDINKVFVRLEIFKSMIEGYLSELREILTPVEIDNLALGAKLIIFEQAVRFLTDYINGDVYYKVQYSEHNLVRARNQFALLESVEKNFENMRKIISDFM